MDTNELNYGYGSLYGYGWGYGDLNGFGYGYGGTVGQKYNYSITISGISSLSAGSYTIKALINTGNSTVPSFNSTLSSFTITSVISAGNTISGTVYNTSINLGNAIVDLINASNTSIAAITTTNSTGGYTFTNIPNGTYYLQIMATTHQDLNTSSFAVSADVPNKNVQMTPLRGKFVGTVYYGTCCSNNYTTAVVSAVQGGAYINYTSTNSSGEYELYIPAGTYDLRAYVSPAISWKLSQTVGPDDTTTTNIELNETTYTISGTVSDSLNTSYNITSASVSISGIGSATTNSNGYYAITGVPKLSSGDYTLTIVATNYHTGTATSGTVTADKTKNIALTPKNGSIIGTISDVHGTGVKSPSITVTKTGGLGSFSTYTATATTSGTYLVDDVPPWTAYNVAADGATSNFNSSTGTTTMTPGGAKTVDLALAKVKISTNPTTQVAPNTPITPKVFTITIDNKGQGQTTYTIGITKGNTTAGANTTLSRNTVVVGASSTNTTTLTVNSSIPGYYNYTVNTTSQSDSDVYAAVTVYLGIYNNNTQQLLVNTVNDTISNISTSIVIDSTINSTNSTDSLIIGSTTENVTLTNSVVKEGSTVNATTLTNATIEGSSIEDATITESTIVDSTIENNTVIESNSVVENTVVSQSTITTNSTVEDAVIRNTTITASSTIQDTNLTSSTISGTTLIGFDVENVTITDNVLTTTTVSDKEAVIVTPSKVEFNLTSETLTSNIPIEQLVPASQNYTNPTTTEIKVNLTDTIGDNKGQKTVEVDLKATSAQDTDVTIAKTKISPAKKKIDNTPPGVGYLYIKDNKGNLGTAIDWFMIKLFYNKNNIGSLRENSLKIQWYNGTEFVNALDVMDGLSNNPVTKGVSNYKFTGYACDIDPARILEPGAVLCGINTEEGYVFANVTHMSIFGMAGSITATTTTTTAGSGGTSGAAGPGPTEPELVVVTAPDQISAGTSADITTTILNTKETIESYIVTLPDLPTGWTITGATTITVGPGETKDNVLTITPPEDAAEGVYTITVKTNAINFHQEITEIITIKVEKAAPPTTVAPPATTAPPTTTAPPVVTVAPPTTTRPPVVTVAPPTTTRPPVITVAPPKPTMPPTTTRPPKTTPPPLTTAPPEKKKGICGPTTILLFAMISALGANLVDKRRIKK